MKVARSLVPGLLMAGLCTVSAWAATPKTSQPARHSESRVRTAFTTPETMSGTLTIVQPQKGLIVVTASNGVPFDFQASRARIEVNGARAKLDSIQQDMNKQITVRFVPYPRGDMARSVTVIG